MPFIILTQNESAKAVVNILFITYYKHFVLQHKMFAIALALLFYVTVAARL